MSEHRAYVLLAPGRRIDLLNPDYTAWTEEDIAIGLSRIPRWAGRSKWPLSLSVAQHSLTVLALREAEGPLTPIQALRELFHDATEAFWGFDCINPLKPHFGAGFKNLDQRLQAAIDQRYNLPTWTADDYAAHKRADHLAAACEAYHVVGWTETEIRGDLDLSFNPIDIDPLTPPDGMLPWEPWPPTVAAAVFLEKCNSLLKEVKTQQKLLDYEAALDRFHLSAGKAGKFFSVSKFLNNATHLLVNIDGPSDPGSFEALVIGGYTDETGEVDLDGEFTVFMLDFEEKGEIATVKGWMCHDIEILAWHPPSHISHKAGPTTLSPDDTNCSTYRTALNSINKLKASPTHDPRGIASPCAVDKQLTAPPGLQVLPREDTIIPPIQTLSCNGHEHRAQLTAPDGSHATATMLLCSHYPDGSLQLSARFLLSTHANDVTADLIIVDRGKNHVKIF
jgi:hypothetical protein